MPKIQIRGLDGIYGLPEATRRNIITDYTNQGLLRNDNSLDRVNRLYRNKQFVDIFGEDIFHRLNVQQRDEMLDRHFLQMEAAKRFSPYHRRDKKGKIISDSKTPIAGEGMSPENYESMMNFDNETLRALLEDEDFVPSNKIASFGEIFDQGVAQSNIPKWKKMGLLLGRDALKLLPISPSLPGISATEEVVANARRKNSDNLFEKYKVQNTKKIEQDNSTSIDDTISQIRNNTNETQRESDFMSMINSEFNPGFSALAALFDEEGKPKKTAAEVMTDDDRTEFLAKYIAMSKVMNPEQLQTYIRNEVANYILDHESTYEKIRKDTQEVGIVSASYGAAQLNGVRMAYKMALPEVDTYMTEDGEIIPIRKVSFDNSKPYTYKDGNKVPLIATKMQPSTLDYLGKDTMGEDYSWFWNNAYWRDVERFNVFDEEEIARARKRGASDMSQVYRDGATSSVPFEVAKMSGFAMMDGAMLIVPTVGGQLAKGISTIGKTGTRLAKAAQWLAKGTEFVTKYAGGTTSAFGISHSYANNAFAENLESNLLGLKSRTRQDAQNAFLDKYSSEEDSSYRESVDARMYEVADNIMAENPNIPRDKAIMLARDEVMQEFVELEEKALMANPEYNYGDKLKQAHETASDAAIAMFVTDGLKYFGVNHFAFRKVLFKTPKQNLESFLRNEGRNVTENEALRMEGNQPLTRGQKLKFLGKTAASQIWGGAWTNYTDEMQMWGNRYLNNDSYKRYLDGEYTDDGLFKMLMGANSFLNGFLHAPVEKTTTMAGVVGGLGGAFGIGFNVAGAATAILSKEGRAQANYYRQRHDRDHPERELPNSKEKPNLTRDIPSYVGLFINNGILNNYNGFKNSNRDINRYVRTVNNWLDDSDNMAAVRKLYELDLASMDATNPTDKAVIDLFKMISAFDVLSNINQIREDGANPTVFDMVANQSSIIREAKELTEKILQGIDEEQASEMLDDYFAQNKGVPRNEKTEAEAIQAIVNNAREIKRAKELYDQAVGHLSALEKTKGQPFDSRVRGKYIESYVLDKYLTNQVNQQERTILGENTQTEEGTVIDNPIDLDAVEDAPHEVYGDKQSKKNYIKSLDKEISEIDAKLEELRNEIAEKEKERKESSSKEHKKELKKQRRSDRKLNKTLDIAADSSLDKELFEARADYEYYERAKEVRERLRDKLQEALDNTEDNKKPKILTKDQIMRLDPESRARMLSPYNRHNYTKAQQKVIDKVISELNKRDPNLLDLIFKQAADIRRARANDALLNEIAVSPERASGVYTATINSNKLTIPQNFYYHNAEVVDQAIRDQIEYNPAFGTAQVKKAVVYNSLINSAFDAQTLRGILDLEESNKFSTIEQYRSEIERAANTIEARTKVQTEINKLEIGDNTKKELLDNAMPIVRDAVDLQDAIDKLTEVVDSPGVAEAQRQLFQTVVDKLKALKSQGEAVVAETKPQAEVREERKADERQDAEDRERKAKEEQERRNAEAREQAKIAIENYRTWSDEHVTIDKENHVYYVDGEPIDYSVTDYYEKEISRKKFPDIYKFAGSLGDGFDAIGRDYFNFIFGRGEDPSTKTYVNYPDALRDKIIDYFKQMHEEFKQKFGENYYAITDTITFVCNFDNNGRKNSIAGTPDMLIVDEQGRVNIVDFKLKREQNFGDWNNDLPYNFQQNGYKQMWEFLTEGQFPIKDIYLMWAKQHYPSEAKETTINGEKKRYHYEVTDKKTGEITIFELRPATNKEISKDAARPQSQKQLITVLEKQGSTYKNVHYAKVETGMKMTDFAENGNWSIDKPVLVEIKERSNPLDGLSKYDKAESEGKPKEEPKPEVVTTINTTRFNATTNREYKGNYQVTKNPDNSFVIDFEGPAEAMRALGKQTLGELNLDFNDLVDKSDPIYDKITALFVSEVNVDSAGRVVLTVNFITPTETNKVAKRTIDGNNAALIFNKLFGEEVDGIVHYIEPRTITERVIKRIPVTYTSKSGNEAKGEYVVTKGTEGHTRIKHEGTTATMKTVSLSDLDSSLDDIIGEKDSWATPENYDEAVEDIKDGIRIEQVVIRPDNTVYVDAMSKTGNTYAIEGKAAEEIASKLFPEVYTNDQPSKVRGRKVVEKNIKIARDESDLMNSTNNEKQKEKHILNMLTAAKLALQNGEKGDAGAISEEEKSELNQMISEAKKLGYELAEHIDVGKRYYEGLKTIARFVEDPSLPKGSQVIKLVVKPQINKNGVMVQASEILVAQNLEEDLSMPPEHIEMGEDGGHTQSPDGEEQLKDATEEGLDVQHANLDENSSRKTGLADIGSANDNLTEEQQDVIYQGNPFFTYNGDVLRNEGRREKRQPDKPDDRFDTIQKWLSNLQDAEDSSVVGVQLQEIIDTELNDIIKVEPTIRVMMVNNHADNTNTSDKNRFIVDTPFLCVEYTDKVKRIHTKGGKNFGGVFTAETLENGEPITKKYLMVGIAGFHNNNPAYTDWWNNGAQVERWSHVSQASEAGRPAQRFYVSPNHKTEVVQIGGGWKVTRGKDGKQTFRDPLELINDPRRNPKGIKSLADLKWGIVFYKEGLITTGLADKTVHAPREILTNLGSTFLMLETANGEYIPIFVQPAKFNDIRNGEIKSMIETTVRRLIDPKYSAREAALEELRQLIVLQESTMNRSEDRPFDISIGDPSNNTIKIKSGSVTVETIDINSPNAAEQLMGAIRSIDPRINITLKALSNPVMVKHLNDAGALKTDLEVLATSNADFTVYPMTSDGRMYVPTEFKPSEPKEATEAQIDAIAAFRQGRSVTLNSTLYRMNDENKWIEAETGKVVTNPVLLDQITKRNYIISNNLDPNYEDSTGKYYIINSDKQHNEVWRYTQKDGKETITKLSVTDGFQIIQKVASEVAEANRQEAARQKLEELKKQEEEMMQRREEQRPKEPTEQELGQQAIRDNSLEIFTDRKQDGEENKEDHSRFMPPEVSEEEKKPKQQRSNRTLEELQNQKKSIREFWQDSSNTGTAFRTEVISIFAEKGLISLGGKTAEQLAKDTAELKRLKIGSKLEKIAKGKEKINGKKYIYDPNVTTIDNWLEILRRC